MKALTLLLQLGWAQGRVGLREGGHGHGRVRVWANDGTKGGALLQLGFEFIRINVSLVKVRAGVRVRVGLRLRLRLRPSGEG